MWAEDNATTGVMRCLDVTLARAPCAFLAIDLAGRASDLAARACIGRSLASIGLLHRQVVGRFVRMQSDLPSSQRAYLYLPRDPRLVEYAEAIKAERDHVLVESAQAEPRTLFDVRPNEAEPFLPLRGVALADGRIGDDEEPATLSDAAAKHQSDALPLHERKEQMRQTHKGLVIQVAQRSGVEHRRINLELVRRTGSRIENASLDQLKRRIKQLEKWVEHPGIANADNVPVTTETEITLASGSQRAVVSPFGALLRRYFRWRTIEKSIPSGAIRDQPTRKAEGDVLCPFPGRIAHGRYLFDGQTFQLDCNDKEGTQRHPRVCPVPFVEHCGSHPLTRVIERDD